MNFMVGNTVERDTQEAPYRGKQGKILQIKGDQAQVQWDKNKTWYKLSNLKLAQ